MLVSTGYTITNTIAVAVGLLFLVAAAGTMPACAQDAANDAARRVFESSLPEFRRVAPDELLDQVRQRVTALLAPLPGFEPGSRMVDLVVERPWPTLRRRCPVGAPLAADGALALADEMLREGRVIARATPQDRGALAAMVAALDGRLCRCTDRASLALAADCAS